MIWLALLAVGVFLTLAGIAVGMELGRNEQTRDDADVLKAARKRVEDAEAEARLYKFGRVNRG